MTSFVTSRARLSILASKSRLNPVGCHIKFIEAEKEALQLYKGHRSCNPHNFQNCFKEILFTGLFIYLFSHFVSWTIHWKCGFIFVKDFIFYMVLPWPQSFDCELLCQCSAHLYKWFFLYFTWPLEGSTWLRHLFFKTQILHIYFLTLLHIHFCCFYLHFQFFCLFVFVLTFPSSLSNF